MKHYLYGGILLAFFACYGCGVANKKPAGANLILPEQITEAGVTFDFAPDFDRASGMMDSGDENNKPENKNHRIFHLYLKGKPWKDYGMIKTGDYVRFTSDNQVFVNGIVRLPK